MKSLADRSIAIIGYAEARNVRGSGRSALDLAAEVLAGALAATGLERTAIDGLACTQAMSEAGNPFWSTLMAETLGLSPTWCQTTDLGGSSNIGNIARAAAAIQAGQCEIAVCIGADAVSTQDLSHQVGHRTEFCDPLGYAGPLVAFGLLSSAYADRYGMPDAALAKLAVAQRRGALDNPNASAVLRKPLTEEEYLASRMVCDPLRLLDCVMRCDGASAFVVTSTATARRLGAARLVHPIAYRERVNFDPRDTISDITISGFSEVGPRVLADAGLKPSDIHMLQPYDDFLIAVLLQLEQIGFCGPGGSQAFLAERSLGYDGDLPINTGGGQVSAGQPGLAGGGVNLSEAVRQLFGEAGPRQVGRHGNALVTGIGVLPYARNWTSSNALVLERGA
ncbi:thiolase family protein [Aquabacter spiritensis]|uniref:Acetyl-CoA acetyltransferase n=1 Tax=Aquabacter spiritensis TaxID=933073 RepID=A0A4R3LX21_9HYPH|nr:thiolase family protein [Aquabacter spiritensis]TCT05194.1 acetyl-CoA acetyltransferase [Aquabacter spiritensis]